MNKTTYLEGDFVDFLNNTRQFTMAATVETFGEYTEISIGIAVRRPDDTYSKETGRKIAKGKSFAQNNTHTMLIGSGISFNSKFVEHILETESNKFKNDPGSYLANYNRDKFRYLKEISHDNYVDAMDDKAKSTWDYLQNLSKEDLSELMEELAYDKEHC